jgi:hypothetical protein
MEAHWTIRPESEVQTVWPVYFVNIVKFGIISAAATSGFVVPVFSNKVPGQVYASGIRLELA